MVLLLALAAGLLVDAESQASDMADRFNTQGFLSQYSFSSGDASKTWKTSLDDYNKLIIPNLNHVKFGNRPDVLSYDKTLPEHDLPTRGTQHLDVNGLSHG